MTTVKLTGKPTAAVSQMLGEHADWLYNNPGGRLVAVVEFQHTDRTEPAPDASDKDRSVNLRMSMLEIASDEQAEVLRKAARAMFTIRTTTGTLDPEGEVEMSQVVLSQTVGETALREAIRLRIAADTWAQRAREAATLREPSVSELRHELEAIAQGLALVSNPHARG